MKYTLSLFAILFLAASCAKTAKTPQEKAEALVKRYLDSTLDDPKSYQSVNFGKVDSVYEPFDLSPEGMAFQEKMMPVDTMVAGIDPSAAVKQKDSLANAYKIAKQKYKPEVEGWKIRHDFRAKNKLGAMELDHVVFKLNKNFTKVDEIKEAEE